MRGVQILNFTKKYGSFVAVDDFSVNFEFGEINCLMGENGAGKSTILKAICGIHEADFGKILIDGEDSASIEARKKVAFVSENPQFIEDCFVREYLFEMFPLVSPENSAKNPQAVADAIEKFSLSEVADKKISTLSKGFRQRLAFAQSFLRFPSVYVFDEPASGLDPVQINEMRRFVLDAKSHATVILSTHLMQEAETLGDRIFVLKRGKLAASGSAGEIAKQFAASNFESAFVKISQN